MKIFEELQPLTDQVQQSLRLSVKEEFPESLKSPIFYFLESPGKNIRPLLTLLSCEAVGAEWERALHAAVGIELFHNFTLIHDDIMDKDDLRRGRSTIHKKWGEETAILVGDALIGLAYEQMLRSDPRFLAEVLTLFNEAFIKVCEGQALDKEFEDRDHVSVEEYLNMISKKTAWLFKLSCQIGAVLGGGNSDQIDHMREFGESLGIGFQIQDDLLDYVGEEDTLGKKVGSDLKMDKKTYISILYEEILKNSGNRYSHRPARLSEFRTIGEIRDTLTQLNIVGKTVQLVEDYIDNAKSHLDNVSPLTEKNKIFRIVQVLQQRRY